MKNNFSKIKILLDTIHISWASNLLKELRPIYNFLSLKIIMLK